MHWGIRRGSTSSSCSAQRWRDENIYNESLSGDILHLENHHVIMWWLHAPFSAQKYIINALYLFSYGRKSHFLLTRCYTEQLSRKCRAHTNLLLRSLFFSLGSSGDRTLCWINTTVYLSLQEWGYYLIWTGISNYLTLAMLRDMLTLPI